MAKEKLRDLNIRPDGGVAAAMVWLYADAFRDKRNPPELRQLGRTITKWRTPIMAWWLHAQISNGPTEGANNLIKRTKRVGFGFTNFANYRIRCLLYARKPNWQLLATLNAPKSDEPLLWRLCFMMSAFHDVCFGQSSVVGFGDESGSQ